MERGACILQYEGNFELAIANEHFGLRILKIYIYNEMNQHMDPTNIFTITYIYSKFDKNSISFKNQMKSIYKNNFSINVDVLCVECIPLNKKYNSKFKPNMSHDQKSKTISNILRETFFPSTNKIEIPALVIINMNKKMHDIYYSIDQIKNVFEAILTKPNENTIGNSGVKINNLPINTRTMVAIEKVNKSKEIRNNFMNNIEKLYNKHGAGIQTEDIKRT